MNIENKHEFLKKIIKKVEDKRPPERKEKKIDTESNIELLLDYTFSLKQIAITPDDYDNITIEIKPKSYLFDDISWKNFQEVILSHSKTETESNLKKFYDQHVSRTTYDKLLAEKSSEIVNFIKYYKVQIKKLHEKSIESISKYDPHNFFAGNHESTITALKELFETPQNNLRIFLNSRLINPAKSEDNDTFYKILKRVFFHSGEHTDILLAFADVLSKILEISKIPSIIKEFQELYPHNGIEIEEIRENTKKLLESTELTNDVLEQILKSLSGTVFGSDSSNTKEKDSGLISQIEIMIKFLISIAFRDCSILMSLHFLNKTNSEDLAEFLLHNEFQELNVENSNERIMFKIGLIDFQMKTYSHLYTFPNACKELLVLYWQYITQKHDI